jgi:hypothetical protein
MVIMKLISNESNIMNLFKLYWSCSTLVNIVLKSFEKWTNVTSKIVIFHSIWETILIFEILDNLSIQVSIQCKISIYFFHIINRLQIYKINKLFRLQWCFWNEKWKLNWNPGNCWMRMICQGFRQSFDLTQCARYYSHSVIELDLNFRWMKNDCMKSADQKIGQLYELNQEKWNDFHLFSSQNAKVLQDDFKLTSICCMKSADRKIHQDWNLTLATW